MNVYGEESGKKSLVESSTEQLDALCYFFLREKIKGENEDDNDDSHK